MQTSFSELEYAAKKKLTRRDRFLAEPKIMNPPNNPEKPGLAGSFIQERVEPYPKSELFGAFLKDSDPPWALAPFRVEAGVESCTATTTLCRATALSAVHLRDLFYLDME